MRSGANPCGLPIEEAAARRWSTFSGPYLTARGGTV